jgi:hypothetical protein
MSAKENTKELNHNGRGKKKEPWPALPNPRIPLALLASLAVQFLTLPFTRHQLNPIDAIFRPTCANLTSHDRIKRSQSSSPAN